MPDHGDPPKGCAPAAAAAPGTELAATIAQVSALLRARGERMTRQRRAVLTVLADSGEHLTAEAVLARAVRLDPGVHRASIYRTLEALSELGVVQHVHVGHGGTAYHLTRGERAHLHAQCYRCACVVDLPAELLDRVADTLRSQHGFRLDAAHVALSGLCADCAGPAGGAGAAVIAMPSQES